MDLAVIPVTIQPGLSDWLTSWGTVGAVITAVGIALFAELRANARVKAERVRSDRVLADERAAAEARLKTQQVHSDAQLREERQQAQDTEQVIEAYSVRVLAESHDGQAAIPTSARNPDRLQCAIVTVINDGRYTITRLRAQLTSGTALYPLDRSADIPLYGHLPERLSTGMPAPFGNPGAVLIPHSMAARFTSAEMTHRDLKSMHPLVRWADQWGQHWEHRNGQMQKIDPDIPWVP